jgi:sarcosine oxidase
VVVGAGAFGGWTALHLLERGVDVTLVDAFGAGNARATSGGDSRGLRFAYGPRRFYTRWAVEAAARWRQREEAWGVRLVEPTGRLSLVPEVTEALRETLVLLHEEGVEAEILGPEEVKLRWPQLSVEGLGGALFEPGATAIRANLACRVVVEAVAREGARVLTGRVRPPEATGGGRKLSVSVFDETGEALEGDAVVFACGSWLPRLFPELLGPVIQVPRRDVFFFGPPPGDPRFSHPRLPNFSEGGHAVYGFPDLDGLGFKVAPYGGLDPFDPDADDRVPSAHWLRRARAYMTLRFPDMANQPLVHSRVCQLENTPDEDFIVDRHPEAPAVWIAGGGSGHAFKHGPVLGAYIAARVLGEDPDPEATRRFRLRFDPDVPPGA